MKEHKLHPTVFMEDAIHDPKFAHLHEAMHFLLNAKEEDLFPNKYGSAWKDLVFQKMAALHKTDPDMSLSKVIGSIIGNLPDTVTPALMLELTAFLIEKWENRDRLVLNLQTI